MQKIISRASADSEPAASARRSKPRKTISGAAPSANQMTGGVHRKLTQNISATPIRLPSRLKP